MLNWVFDFATCFFDVSMSKAVERYHQSSYGQNETNQSPNMDQNTYEEYLKLKERAEALQQSQRHVLGEDLAKLGIKELDQLEHVLDGTLKQIRHKKNHSLCDQLSDLQQKERSLLELNAALMSKLEGSGSPPQSTWHLQHEVNARYQHTHFLEPNNNTPEIRLVRIRLLNVEGKAKSQSLGSIGVYRSESGRSEWQRVAPYQRGRRFHPIGWRWGMKPNRSGLGEGRTAPGVRLGARHGGGELGSIQVVIGEPTVVEGRASLQPGLEVHRRCRRMG
ncbi:hypothetical protein SASPL_140477 [Salvia splendens]|uniref:K-box domain-containing protein n=1 Tax=Salvia splendens TaxID=180675 RepID=A0A8X8WQT9_SALSN|nr:hypothetical protein SASPL_140477 [Salvia splendens]